MLDFTKFLHFAELPGQSLSGDDAFVSFAPDAVDVELAVAQYKRDGDEHRLFEALSAVGFDPAEIAELAAAPGTRPECAWVSCAD